jgi:hypothetical protein
MGADCELSMIILDLKKRWCNKAAGMNFILDNIYIIVIAAAGLVQWWKSTQDAKKERENQHLPEEYSRKQLEEFQEQAERRHSRPTAPPPLPRGSNPVPPSFDRSPTPALKKSRPTSEAKAFVMAPHYQEEALQAELERQAAIAEQLSGLKQARKKQEVILRSKREKAKPAMVSGSIRDRLKNRSELRQAFVLKEFLEKPLGLR